MAFSLQEETEE